MVAGNTYGDFLQATDADRMQEFPDTFGSGLGAVGSDADNQFLEHLVQTVPPPWAFAAVILPIHGNGSGSALYGNDFDNQIYINHAGDSLIVKTTGARGIAGGSPIVEGAQATLEVYCDADGNIKVFYQGGDISTGIIQTGDLTVSRIGEITGLSGFTKYGAIGFFSEDMLDHQPDIYRYLRFLLTGRIL